MTSETDICNRALSAIGTSTKIASLTETSTEARECSLLYAPTRDQVLRTARWNFATKMATMTLLKALPGTPENPTPSTSNVWVAATMPQLPWVYSYAYPSDAMLIQRVPIQFPSTQGGSIPLDTGNAAIWLPTQSAMSSARFAVAQDTDASGNPNKVVLTNMSQAIAVYTAETINPNLFDALFTETLVAALAGRLAINLTGDKAMMKLMFDVANADIIQARASDGNEGITTQDHLPDFIAVRSGGSAYGMSAYGLACEPYAPLFGGWA